MSSAPTSSVASPSEAEERDRSQDIHVEERRLTLHDFLKTAIKINGSDIHLQAGSVPMIRVDGKAKFLDVPPLADEWLKEYVDQILAAQAEPHERHQILDHKGSVDVAYPLPGIARFRTNIFHSKEKRGDRRPDAGCADNHRQFVRNMTNFGGADGEIGRAHV